LGNGQIWGNLGEADAGANGYSGGVEMGSGATETSTVNIDPVLCAFVCCPLADGTGCPASPPMECNP
jgi:hypothetical protein